MPFVQAKCPDCGGILAVDDSKKAANCQFCGNAFIVEEAVNNYITYNITNNTTNNVTNIGEGAVVHIHEDGNKDSVSALLERAFMFLEDGDWKSANEYCEKVLDIDPENGLAYYYKFMAEANVYDEKGITMILKPLELFPSFKKAVSFGDEKQREFLTEAAKEVNSNVLKIKKRKRKKTVSIVFSIITFFVCLLLVCYNLYCKNEFEAESLILLKDDATVIGTAWYGPGRLRDVSDWEDIVDISLECRGADSAIGLKSDGTLVVAAAIKGYVTHGRFDVDYWTDIVDVSLGSFHTVGLKSDGTVIATEIINEDKCNRDYGQCDVENWTDIIAVSAGALHTVGLKSDGTVVAVGSNIEGQCNVSNWTDIIEIHAMDACTIGLKSDGTVIATGKWLYNENVSDWKDISTISASEDYIVGLKSDGTVVAMCGIPNRRFNLKGWTDIVSIYAAEGYIVGLKSDGTIVYAGGGISKLKKQYKSDAYKNEDIVKIFAS